MSLRELLHLRSGEARKVFIVAAIGACYVGATSVGEDISETVFVTRIGAEELPRTFLAKAVLDVAASLIYLWLARGRRAGSVWRIAIGLYTAALIAAWSWAHTGSIASTYGLYIVHEAAWTILTLHWAVFILDVFDANQARRLFPLLFSATRLGGAATGAALGSLAFGTQVLNLLGIAVALALAAGALSFFSRGHESPPPQKSEQPMSRREVLRSPLVRAIALSTAVMVLTRYGLKLVSLQQIQEAYVGNQDAVLAFLGRFRVWGNIASIILGVMIVPRLLSRFGVGAVNVIYAVATVVGYAVLLAAPSLASAATARFAGQQFKDAVRTPLTALFYGAERPAVRPPARALMFGVVIPLATALTAAAFEIAGYHDPSLVAVAIIGAACAAFFVAASLVLNRAWRRRLRALLAHRVAELELDETELKRTWDELSRLSPSTPGPVGRDIALALCSGNREIAALGEEVWAENGSRHVAHKQAQILAAKVKSSA